MDKCDANVPANCSDIIPYTTYPNDVFGLNSTEEYKAFGENITAALMTCTSVDEDVARWGVCNMMFPRCLLGFELQLCQESCMGKCVYCEGVRHGIS